MGGSPWDIRPGPIKGSRWVQSAMKKNGWHDTDDEEFGYEYKLVAQHGLGVGRATASCFINVWCYVQSLEVMRKAVPRMSRAAQACRSHFLLLINGFY